MVKYQFPVIEEDDKAKPCQFDLEEHAASLMASANSSFVLRHSFVIRA
jgi:hypothetical protein